MIDFLISSTGTRADPGTSSQSAAWIVRAFQQEAHMYRGYVWKKLNGLSTTQLCAGIFVISLAVRLLAMFLTQSYLQVDERSEIVWVARSLAEHGTYAGAYGASTGPR